MTDLTHSIERVEEISEDTVRNMYSIYKRYYDGTSETLFRQDLFDKEYVILLSDENGFLRGFSTATTAEHTFEGQKIRSFFSGDTIIDEQYWGSQALPTAWFKLTGEIKATQRDVPLYWFLLVKGHRTYRYLNAFFREYYPAHDQTTPLKVKSLMDALAKERFGSSYKVDQGLVKFPTSHGHLKQKFAEIPIKDAKRPAVAYFLELNPGYINGDELVCLTELSAMNLHPRAEKLFRSGMESGY